MCQNFLTAKRKLDEGEVQKIMENNNLVKPVAPGAVVANGDASHGATQSGSQAAGPTNAPGAGQGIFQFGSQAAGPSNFSGASGGAYQGANQGAVLNGNTFAGPGGGNSFPAMAPPARNTRRNNNNNNTNNAVAHANQVPVGIGMPIGIPPSHPPEVAYEKQAYLLDKIQQCALAPDFCPPDLLQRYKLVGSDADLILFARYSEFLIHSQVLCYVRISLTSPIYPEHSLWAMYVPRFPDRPSLLQAIDNGLFQRGQMDGRYITHAFCVQQDEWTRELKVRLDNNTVIRAQFRKLAQEQATTGIGLVPFGARLLPLIEVELALRGIGPDPTALDSALPGNVQETFQGN